MAGASLLTLIDDIAVILDDVAVMTKVAATKTAGVLGDDLALNAQQVSGVKAERELPVVWAVAKGSMVNKCILVPAALLISVILPAAILPLLMLGGAYLCFEGFEKIAHSFLHPEDDHKDEMLDALKSGEVDLVEFEQNKIKGAIRTDFILSAEIITIALGTVATAPFLQKVLVLIGIAMIMTVGVYGLVAGIVKLDDAGVYLTTHGKNAFTQGLGKLFLLGAPLLMKLLGILGTAAMFMVGGGIVVHGIEAAHHAVEHLEHVVHDIPAVGGVLSWFTAPVINGLVGIAVGAVLVLIWTAIGKLRNKPAESH